ncbi:hypothetical protein Cob_v007997 [Colletotrichum orbiculare MAFF 240422]|uniref:Uncharacterized protein n=1 Tax=Colletotrichum orbiculare (strain 104-T / ATCC 96160 / CBS 514.97 / LARS 414 / MAFF 240422) TaxID=1213857 RepID=N4VRY4_COLOR|nr:hypothetical protein Cob_v007997 [Colletotrichum orbiculare MAFF 240422]
MAGAIQLGDVINFSKLAWDVYRFGWENDFNATRQYAEFGRDVKNLARNLDILGRVVDQAECSLRQGGAYQGSLRWDSSSLGEIIGDYRETLTECAQLLDNNHRYSISSGPLRNIEWNVLVAPTADRLRARIALHNAKVLHVLKPFEIDLLCRVREDIQRLRQDLVNQIQAVHVDLRRLIGVLVPDLEQALNQQAREPHSLEIPISVSNGLERAWRDRPEEDPSPSLQEMTDAFVIYFNKSTFSFAPMGILVENKIPPVRQFVNLLKCIWLKRRIKNTLQSQRLPDVSHWPSYVKELENDLSAQCARFEDDLVQPSLDGLLTADMLEIWPEREPPQLLDVVTKDALMEQVLDVPLQGSGAKVQRKLQLLRRMDADGRRFRVNISGEELGATKSARRRAETIDFDITSVILRPIYAVPSKSGALDVTLQKDERLANLAFTGLKDLVKFQQGVTGFKVFDRYNQYNATVTFIVSGRNGAVEEDACIQLWVPAQLDGQLVTSNEASMKDDAPGRSASVRSSAYDSNSRQSTLRSVFDAPDFFTRSPTETVSPMHWGNVPPQAASPTRVASVTSAPILNGPNTPGFRPPMSIPRRPVGSSSQMASSAPPNSSRQVTMSTSPSSPRSSNLFPGTWASPPRASSFSTTNSRPDRTFSVSSNVSTTTSPSNHSSGKSEAHTVTVNIGGHTTGTVHRRPPNPMMVFFTQNRATKKLALVTVEIDEETAVNADRCNCRRSGRDGASCRIASVEQKRGTQELLARRFESSDGDMDWNLAKLALGRRGERAYAAAVWKDVRRISIDFPTPAARELFGGVPNMCKCKSRTVAELSLCLKSKHKGHLGLVQEARRRQLNEYHQARHESQQEVVRGMRDDY